MREYKNVGYLIIGIAVVIFAGAFLFAANNFSKQGSYVEVKGLAERIVKSDIAVWTIGFDVKSNNVDELYSTIEKNTASIKKFLLAKGFETSEINFSPVNIYQDTYRDAMFRYNSSIQLSVYTKKVDLVKSSSQETLLLVKEGVALNSNYINFEFTGINDIKPEMLQEAIANAKISADSFAKNSGTQVLGISRANQGVFDITDKDSGSPEYKKVRVVSSLRFLLK